MTEDNMTRVTFLAPEDSWEEAKEKAEHGEMSERFRAEVDTVAHGEDVAEETRLTDRLQTLREDRRDLRRERDQIESDLEEVDRKIERVEARLDELREQDGEYDGALAAVESQLEEGVRVTPGAPAVKSAARLGDVTPKDVIQDIRERNPSYPDMAFRTVKGDELANWKEEQEKNGGGEAGEVELESIGGGSHE